MSSGRLRKALFAIVAVAAVALVLALVLPQVLVRDEVDEYGGAQREAAITALRLARLVCANSGREARLTRALSVIYSRRLASPGVAPSEFPTELEGYEIRLRRYTFFALPYGEILVREDAIDCDAGDG